ncbi:MAG: DMT family transporter [Spirochaetales bacterium]|nr:DMT family transporter [Spirochaetales bacterium]
MTRRHPLSFPASISMALLSSICWSVAPVLSRFVRDYYSVSFQNFFRFGVSLCILWIFTLARLGRSGVHGAFSSVSRPVLKLTGLSVCIFIHQMLYLAGIYRLYPALASLLSEGNVVYTILMAYLMFRDERSTIRNVRFILGMALALGGMAVIILTGSRIDTLEADLGVIFIVLSALAWSFFTVLTKHWIPTVPASLSTSVIFTINTLMFLIVILFPRGPVLFPVKPPPSAWLILALSGLLGIGGGYTFYFAAIPGAGVTLTSSLGLLIPLFTALSSYLILGELLLPLQVLAGIVLLGGCYLIIRARYRA